MFNESEYQKRPTLSIKVIPRLWFANNIIALQTTVSFFLWFLPILYLLVYEVEILRMTIRLKTDLDLYTWANNKMINVEKSIDFVSQNGTQLYLYFINFERNLAKFYNKNHKICTQGRWYTTVAPHETPI